MLMWIHPREATEDVFHQIMSFGRIPGAMQNTNVDVGTTS